VTTKKIFLMITFLSAITTDVFATCSSGNSEVTGLSGSAFMAPVNGLCDAPGYALVTVDDSFELFYSGLIVGDGVTLCTNGRMVNGTCVSYSAGDCSSGNYSVVENAAIIAPVNGKCDAPGYSYTSIDNDFYGIYRGMVVGDEVTLCDDGRKVNGTCTAYTTGTCDSGYYDTGIDTNTFGSPTNEACSNPYTARSDITRCDHNPGDTCVDIPTPTINVTWYNNGATVGAQTCYYGESLSLPTPPTRPGYTFGGWRVVTQ